MYIECENCGAGYELDLPPAALAGGRSVKFRCTACGHSFHVVKNGTVVDARPRPETSAPSGPAVAEASKPAAQPAGADGMEHVLLRQEGVSYHVPDVATLQRWIVERRVLPTDELDFGGGQWVKAGERADLAPFFSIVSEVEVATRKLAAVAVDEAFSPGLDGELDSSDDFETEIASDVDAERKTVVVNPDDHPTTAGGVAAEAENTGGAAGDVFDLASSADASTIPAVWDEPPSDSVYDSMAPSSQAVEAPQAPTGLMGSGEVPLEWDLSVPETEEAERPGFSDGSSHQDTEHFERSSLLPDGEELESAPTEAYTPSTSALWPEADPPSSPFSMPTVADETEEAPRPTVLHEEAAPADAPAPSEELAWADELFRDAPLPGEPSIDEVFDQPTSVAPEPDLSDEPAELVGNAEDDSSPLPPDDDGWFAVVDDNGDESFSRRSQSFTGWLFIGGAVALALGFWFLRNGGTEIATPDRITVNTAGNGANQPAEGAEPAETPKEEGAETPSDAQADPREGDASPAEGDASPAEGDGASSTGGEEAAEAAPKPEEPPKEAARPARPAKTAEAIANRGWRSIDRSRIEEAEKHFSDALKIDPNHAVATYGLAYIAQRRNNNARAIDLYCRARSLAGSNRELVREVDAGLNRLKATCP